MVYLRMYHPDGTPRKDWKISQTPNGGLTIQYGATGKRPRTTNVPAGSFSGSAQAEMQKRIQEKIAKGYQDISNSNDPDVLKAKEAAKEQVKAEKMAKGREEMKSFDAVAPSVKPWF